MKHIFKQEIIPNKLICNSSFYDITIIDPEFIINEFCIFTDDNNKIEDVCILKGIHPNCDLNSKFLCIPDYLRKFELNDNSIKIILNILEVFNFDSSFFQPWYSFEYNKERIEYGERED